MHGLRKQGNVFTLVCHSVHTTDTDPLPGQTPPLADTAPWEDTSLAKHPPGQTHPTLPQGRQPLYRMVRILPKCIIVDLIITYHVLIVFREYSGATRTRKHSSRMHSIPLETIHASVSLATTKCHSRGGGGGKSQMNKFEQVSSDHHQMSLAGESQLLCHIGVSGLIFRWVPYLSWGVPYHVTYPMLHLMLPTPLRCEQTDTCESITFIMQRYLRPVIITHFTSTDQALHLGCAGDRSRIILFGIFQHLGKNQIFKNFLFSYTLG